jgi:hypothetical protein
MKTQMRVLVIVIVFLMIAQFLTNGSVLAQGSYVEYLIRIDHTAHQRYGLYYPVTYRFQIPTGSSNLTAQYRYNRTDSWVTLTERTSLDFFNGINAVRFDYPNNRAYISVAFSSTVDDIYVHILNGGSPISFTYMNIPLYYDNRHAAVTVTLDDWDSQSNNWGPATQTLVDAHVHYTGNIITGNDPAWGLIQYRYNEVYGEPGSHTFAHPCSNQAFIDTGGFVTNITGSRDTILSHLTLAYPYVPVYAEPCGFQSPEVRQVVVATNYLVERGYLEIPPNYMDTFSNWGVDGAYTRTTMSYQTYDWPDPPTNAQRDEANARFDAVYAASGIYHLVDHPNQGHLANANTPLGQHITHIANHLDIWYAAFGELYLYHYVQERGQVQVSPVDPTAVTLSSFGAREDGSFTNALLVLGFALIAGGVAFTASRLGSVRK